MDARRRCDRRTVANADLPVDHRRTADFTIFTYRSTAGDAGAGSDDCPVSYAIVMADMYQIIYFYSVPYDGATQSCSIYCRVRTDLYIVAYFYITQVFYLHPIVAVRHEAETVATDYCTRLYYDTPARARFYRQARRAP